MAKGIKLSAKITLDAVMFLILVLLYKAKVLTLTYHEVAGIGILLVFLIHCLFNWRWIAANAKKLFSPQTPARTKFSYWLSIALVVSFLIIVVSGIFISKVLFKEQIAALALDTSIFRTLHLFFSALSLILVGMHLGLYWGIVKGFFRKAIKLPSAITKPVCYILLAVIVAFGVYSVPTSGFSQWLLCPVVPMQHSHGDKGAEAAQVSGESGEAETEKAATAENGERTGKERAAQNAEEAGEDQIDKNTEGSGKGAREANQNTEKSERDAQKAEEQNGHQTKNGQGSRHDNEQTSGTSAEEEQTSNEGKQEADSTEGSERSDGGEQDSEQAGKSRSGNHGNNIEASNVLLTIAQFTSIIGLFAAITYYINEGLRRRKSSSK